MGADNGTDEQTNRVPKKWLKSEPLLLLTLFSVLGVGSVGAKAGMSVDTKLEELKKIQQDTGTAVVEIRATLKANDADKARLEAVATKLEERVRVCEQEIATLKASRGK